MKHKIWIIIGIIAAVAAAGLTIGILHIDRVASETADKQLRAAMAERGLPVTWSSLHIRVGQGTVRLDSLRMYMQTELNSGRDSAYILAEVPRIHIGHIHWGQLLRERHLHIDEIRLSRPRVAVRSVEEVLPTLLQAAHDSTRQAMPIERVSVDAIRLTDGSVRLTEAGGRQSVEADSLQAGVHGICFHFGNSSLHYCDSVYHLALSNLHYTTPDGLMRVTCKHMETADAGSMVLRSLRIANTDRKERHADNCGKQPATWVHGTIHEIRTSPVNIVRTLVNRRVDIGSLSVAGDSIYIYRDNHYKPRRPYPMPQEALLAIDVPVHVGRVGLSLRALTAEITEDSIHSGQFMLGRTDVTLSPLTNRAGQHVKTEVKSSLPEQGTIHLDMDLTLNKTCDFTLATLVEDCRMESFNRFLHSQVGIETGGYIRHLEMNCKGDNVKSEGEFCMQYDSLHIHVLKDETPIARLSKFAGIINTFAPAVLRTHNPRSKGEEAQRYTVSGVRDPWQLFPLYLIVSPLSDGILQTVLPPALEKTVKKTRQEMQK